MSPHENSCYPYNHVYASFKERCDADKAFKEWVGESPQKVFTPTQMKAFAVWFAIRVKGGAL
jgi:hypothetical protein